MMSLMLDSLMAALPPKWFTTMHLITKPSSRYGERRLPSAFLVFDHPEQVEVKNIWAGLTTIDPGGAYDHPDFLKEQAALRAQGKLPTANTESNAYTFC